MPNSVEIGSFTAHFVAFNTAKFYRAGTGQGRQHQTAIILITQHIRCNSIGLHELTQVSFDRRQSTTEKADTLYSDYAKLTSRSSNEHAVIGRRQPLRGQMKPVTDAQHCEEYYRPPNLRGRLCPLCFMARLAGRRDDPFVATGDSISDLHMPTALLAGGRTRCRPLLQTHVSVSDQL